MKRERPTPPACDSEIFQNGTTVLAIDGRSADVEKWVKGIAEQTGEKVDWHYSGGVAQILHLGDVEGRNKVHQAAHDAEKKLKGRVLRVFTSSEEGLYRQGVTPVSDNTIAGFYEGGSSSTFIKE